MSREKSKKIKKANKNIKKACDKGTIDDLIDAVIIKKQIALVCTALILCGCTTINVTTVKSWEGRYDTKAEAVQAAEEITLDGGESVWILSSRTLKRLLTNDTKD